jgi:predicted RNA binding protein YcfA (HicA-like mRNA interferase family)
MSRLPLLKPKELIKILVGFGFKPVRQQGSHVFLEHADRRTTVIPCHQGEEIRRVF